MATTANATKEETRVRYRAGTLTYTQTGLVMLFFWLLWGYFVFGLMEIIIPNLLPLILRQHKASNTEVSFITTSLNVIGNMIFNPIVSFSSDRCRSRYGRRRPYIAWTTPMVVLCLALIPFGPDIARFLQGFPAAKALLDLSPVVPPVLLIAVFVAGFQIFDTFVGAVYFYLVRDTVPECFMGRFYGMFRLVGAIAPLLFNLFIFGRAEQYMKPIFVIIAVFYGMGIYLVCWRVKEGEFPPPEPLPGNAANPWNRMVGSVRLYLSDCFRHRIYWSFFLAAATTVWGGAAGAFGILFTRHELGIPLSTLGRIGAVGSVLTLVTAVPWGWVADKANNFRIVQVVALIRALLALLCFFFVRDAVTLLVFSVLTIVPYVASSVAIVKVQLAVWPRDKYGQFGSANSAFASLGMIGFAVVAAKFVDWMESYRSQYLWVAAFGFVSVFFYVALEKQWLRMGGKNGYRAP